MFLLSQRGHMIAECPILKRKHQSDVPAPKGVGFAKTVTAVELEVKPDPSFEPFLMEGFISVNVNPTERVKIKILLDTSTTQSFVVAGVLPFTEQTFSGSNALVQGIEMGMVKVPLHDIHLQSELCSGFVQVGVRKCLPVRGVEFILGNDLAGGKVFPVLQVLDNPTLFEQSNEVAETHTEIFPICAVLRVQEQKQDDF